jgi:hypothetical protein
MARLPQAAPAVEVALPLAYGSVEASALAWACHQAARFVREEGMLERRRFVDDRIVTKWDVRPAPSATEVL